jgi:phosphotriesterase-related protein
MTVLGPIAPEELGVTLSHEHLLIDLRSRWSPPTAPERMALADAPPTPENWDLLQRDPYESRSNLVLDEPDVAAEEVRAFREAGGRSLIDMTTAGLDPRPRAVAEISHQSGVHVVMGCGAYWAPSHPQWVTDADEGSLAERWRRELTEGFQGAFGPLGRPVRAGFLGELGTSSPIDPAEVKVLRAAARAHQATGAAVEVHPSIWEHEAPTAVGILTDAGVPPERIAMAHMDELAEPDYHLEVAKTGCYLSFDTFCSETVFESDGSREPTDEERIYCLLRLLDAGYAERLLLSHDVCLKMQWKHYGGPGYDALLRRVVPRLRKRGVTQKTLDLMLVENPARLFSRSA